MKNACSPRDTGRQLAKTLICMDHDITPQLIEKARPVSFYKTTAGRFIQSKFGPELPPLIYIEFY